MHEVYICKKKTEKLGTTIRTYGCIHRTCHLLSSFVIIVRSEYLKKSHPQRIGSINKIYDKI